MNYCFIFIYLPLEEIGISRKYWCFRKEIFSHLSCINSNPFLDCLVKRDAKKSGETCVRHNRNLTKADALS